MLVEVEHNYNYVISKKLLKFLIPSHFVRNILSPTYITLHDRPAAMVARRKINFR